MNTLKLLSLATFMRMSPAFEGGSGRTVDGIGGAAGAVEVREGAVAVYKRIIKGSFAQEEISLWTGVKGYSSTYDKEGTTGMGLNMG